MNPKMAYTRNMLHTYTNKQKRKNVLIWHHSCPTHLTRRSCAAHTLHSSCRYVVIANLWLSNMQLVRYIYIQTPVECETTSQSQDFLGKLLSCTLDWLVDSQSINSLSTKPSNQPKGRSHTTSTPVFTFARPSGSNWLCCAGCSNPPCYLPDQSPYTPHTVTAMTGPIDPHLGSEKNRNNVEEPQTVDRS